MERDLWGTYKFASYQQPVIADFDVQRSLLLQDSSETQQKIAITFTQVVLQ